MASIALSVRWRKSNYLKVIVKVKWDRIKCGTWHMFSHSSEDSKDKVYCSVEPGLMVLTTCQTNDKVLQALTAFSLGGVYGNSLLIQNSYTSLRICSWHLFLQKRWIDCSRLIWSVSTNFKIAIPAPYPWETKTPNYLDFILKFLPLPLGCLQSLQGKMLYIYFCIPKLLSKSKMIYL